MSLITWILFLFALGIVNLTVGVRGMRSFLSQETSIRTDQSLRSFKSMVRKQMYQAILQIIILGTMCVLGILGIINGRLNFTGFVIFLLLNVINIFAGKWGKNIEKQTRSLKVEDQKFLDEYKMICRTWIRKPFPDF